MDLFLMFLLFRQVYCFMDNQNSSGTWTEALSTMTFHRGKMNEYLCRNYLASEIISGEPHFEAPLSRSLPPLLEQPGSQSYQSWLDRSSTLEDIYSHYELEGAEDAPQENVYTGGDFDGEVTGYAMVGNNKVSADVTGYGVGTSYGVPKYQGSLKKADKGMKLAELFQLALTAIAFLAFGMFIVEVIMCIMGLEDSNQTQILVGDPIRLSQHYQKLDTEEIHRQSRQLVTLKLNELTAKALQSFEAVVSVQNDKGLCLQRAICEGNRYSRSLKGLHRIWIPLWNFGMSWMGARLLHSSHLYAVWRFLEAAILGLGGSSCEKNYQNCSLRKSNNNSN